MMSLLEARLTILIKSHLQCLLPITETKDSLLFGIELQGLKQDGSLLLIHYEVINGCGIRFHIKVSEERSNCYIRVKPVYIQTLPYPRQNPLYRHC